MPVSVLIFGFLRLI